jgi:Na+-transporting methylmalonyl-CoA/oxaloacetate decarboxylase gamma subunit
MKLLDFIILSDIWEFGITLTIIGYTIVLLALVFLFLVYLLIPKALDLYTRAKLRRAGKKESAEESTIGHTGEVNAAISMAIYLCMSERHDMESGKITAKKLSKRYSPWSSKIYTIQGGINSRF